MSISYNPQVTLGLVKDIDICDMPTSEIRHVTQRKIYNLTLAFLKIDMQHGNSPSGVPGMRGGGRWDNDGRLSETQSIKSIEH